MAYTEIPTQRSAHSTRLFGMTAACGQDELFDELLSHQIESYALQPEEQDLASARSGGLGKSLAKKICQKVAAHLTAALQGQLYRGEFEKRMQKLLKELAGLRDEVILFIDEIHMALGAGETEKGSSMDAAAQQIRVD
ncbi:CLPB1 [Symbiodinium sp. CCMP2592]|nr:CLPB1 [Symbiodinium sp. CCMP2592]